MNFYISAVASPPPPPREDVLRTPNQLVSRGLRVALPDSRCCQPTTPEVVQLGNSVPGGTVLVVNLPPPTHHHSQEATPATSATLLSTYSHTYIEVNIIQVFFLSYKL